MSPYFIILILTLPMSGLCGRAPPVPGVGEGGPLRHLPQHQADGGHLQGELRRLRLPLTLQQGGAGEHSAQRITGHSENSPTKELPTADCCKTGIFDNKYREESFIFIWLSKKGLASMTKSVMIMQGTEKV